MCHLVQQDQGGIRCEGLATVGTCPEGKIPSLAPENHEVWGLFRLMMPGLIQQGGYDYNAIQVILDCYSIDQGTRPRILAQILKLIDVIEAEKKARQK